MIRKTAASRPTPGRICPSNTGTRSNPQTLAVYQTDRAGRNYAAGLFVPPFSREARRSAIMVQRDVVMKQTAYAIWIAVLISILALGCGSSTGKDLYKDKDKPKPAEKEK